MESTIERMTDLERSNDPSYKKTSSQRNDLFEIHNLWDQILIYHQFDLLLQDRIELSMNILNLNLNFSFYTHQYIWRFIWNQWFESSLIFQVVSDLLLRVFHLNKKILEELPNTMDISWSLWMVLAVDQKERMPISSSEVPYPKESIQENFSGIIYLDR